MSYIEREVALQIIDNYAKAVSEDGKAVVDAIRDIVEVITPTADVEEVRHGYWLSAHEYAVKLGETNEIRLGNAERDKIWHFCSLCEQQVRFKRNFCPECGAKMDGERRSEKMSENIGLKNIGKKEYVEKESLAKHIDNSFGEISTPFVVKEIRNFPVSDVVEVVRCKDCIFCRYVSSADIYKCDRRGYYTEEVKITDYCSRGERRGK